MASDLSIDPGHDRIVDADMASGSSIGLHVTVAPGSSGGHSDQYVSRLSKASDINMVSGCSPDHRHLDGFGWQHGP